MNFLLDTTLVVALVALIIALISVISSFIEVIAEDIRNLKDWIDEKKQGRW